jgi:hypothetical protein
MSILQAGAGGRALSVAALTAPALALLIDVATTATETTTTTTQLQITTELCPARIFFALWIIASPRCMSRRPSTGGTHA